MIIMLTISAVAETVHCWLRKKYMGKAHINVLTTVAIRMKLQVAITVCLCTQHYARSAYIIIWEVEIYDTMCSRNRTAGNANSL